MQVLANQTDDFKIRLEIAESLIPAPSEKCPAPGLLLSMLKGQIQLSAEHHSHLADCAFCRTYIKVLDQVRVNRPCGNGARDVVKRYLSQRFDMAAPLKDVSMGDIHGAVPVNRREIVRMFGRAGADYSSSRPVDCKWFVKGTTTIALICGMFKRRLAIQCVDPMASGQLYFVLLQDWWGGNSDGLFVIPHEIIPTGGCEGWARVAHTKNIARVKVIRFDAKYLKSKHLSHLMYSWDRARGEHAREAWINWINMALENPHLDDDDEVQLCLLHLKDHISNWRASTKGKGRWIYRLVRELRTTAKIRLRQVIGRQDEEPVLSLFLH